MALKADRQIDAVELSYYMNEVATRGTIAVVSTAGSGIVLDNVNSVATISTSPSGKKPIGMLLQEVVNIDLTRYPVNFHRDQVNSGSKVTLVRKGWLSTDQIVGTPNAQDFAVLYDSGKVSGLVIGSATYNESAYPKIGRFLSKVDQAGYARVEIDL